MTEGVLRAGNVWHRVIVGIACVGLLGACDDSAMMAPTKSAALVEDSGGLTPAEQQLRAKTEEKRKVESTMAGAAGGAVLGALTGYLIGGWQGAAIGAATGVAAGAVAGYSYGSYMNAKARTYSNAEARAAAVSKSADETLAYYDQVNASAQTILTEQQAKIEKLNADYRAGSVTKEQYRAQLASANTNQVDLQEQIVGADKQIGEMRSDTQSGNLTDKINQLQTKRDSLKQTYDQLVALYGTVPTEVQQQTPPIVVVAK